MSFQNSVEHIVEHSVQQKKDTHTGLQQCEGEEIITEFLKWIIPLHN